MIHESVTEAWEYTIFWLVKLNEYLEFMLIVFISENCDILLWHNCTFFWAALSHFLSSLRDDFYFLRSILTVSPVFNTRYSCRERNLRFRIASKRLCGKSGVRCSLAHFYSWLVYSLTRELGETVVEECHISVSRKNAYRFAPGEGSAHVQIQSVPGLRHVPLRCPARLHAPYRGRMILPHTRRRLPFGSILIFLSNCVKLLIWNFFKANKFVKQKV